MVCRCCRVEIVLHRTGSRCNDQSCWPPFLNSWLYRPYVHKHTAVITPTDRPDSYTCSFAALSDTCLQLDSQKFSASAQFEWTSRVKYSLVIAYAIISLICGKDCQSFERLFVRENGDLTHVDPRPTASPLSCIRHRLSSLYSPTTSQDLLPCLALVVLHPTFTQSHAVIMRYLHH